MFVHGGRHAIKAHTVVEKVPDLMIHTVILL